MHPAFSVIFFTSVSGAGYGLLFLASLLLAIDPGLLDRQQTLTLIVAGALFAAAGLTSSMLHLGKPLRAWRAFSQWRSSWLSREGVAALAGFVPTGVLALCVWRGSAEMCLRALAVVVALFAVLTVYCTARIYTSLKTIPAWHQGLVLPGYLLFALLGGAAWMWALFAMLNAENPLASTDIPMLVAFAAAACALIKREYWQSIDTAAATATAESATGLGRFGNVHGVEAPHTEENYLTQEMGFVLARKHAARLRVVALVLFAVLPVAAAIAALVFATPAAKIGGAAVAMLGVTAGTFVERWLFFAEAKHVVMLYYGAARS